MPEQRINGDGEMSLNVLKTRQISNRLLKIYFITNLECFFVNSFWKKLLIPSNSNEANLFKSQLIWLLNKKHSTSEFAKGIFYCKKQTWQLKTHNIKAHLPKHSRQKTSIRKLPTTTTKYKPTQTQNMYNFKSTFKYQ